MKWLGPYLLGRMWSEWQVSTLENCEADTYGLKKAMAYLLEEEKIDGKKFLELMDEQTNNEISEKTSLE